MCLIMALACARAQFQQTEAPRVLVHPAAASESQASPSQGYAVVIGISSYSNLSENDQFLYAERDAELIYSNLTGETSGNYLPGNVHALIGPNATLAGIRHELEEWLPSVAEEDDRILIYFVGHGYVHQGLAFLGPSDVDPNDPAGSGFPVEDLVRVLEQRVKARHKVLFVDVRYGTAATPGSADRDPFLTASLDSGSSLFLFSASRNREKSREDVRWGGGHGVFTFYLVRGLEGEADTDSDGVVTADELAEYTRRSVREATDARQNPTEHGSYDPRIPLAHLSEAFRARPAMGVEPRFGGFVFESNLDGVEVYVDGIWAGVVNSNGPPLPIPGMRPGVHTIKAVKMGYDPFGPREEIVHAGQELRVRINIDSVRKYEDAAVNEVERGVEDYVRGFPNNYRKAIEHFDKALTIDATYSRAALHLGRAYSALYDYENARISYRRALEIDPDYMEARAGLGGMLLDIGDFDEAILQLTKVVHREPGHALGHSMLAQAYRMKEMYEDSIESARIAIRQNPDVAEPHFFLADSLRLIGALDEARAEYQQYLLLSDFESSAAQKVLNYWVRGFLIGGGEKKQAGQKDIWSALRSRAYLGLGECERASNPDGAIAYYEKALALDKENPQIYWALGLALTLKAELTSSPDALRLARKHFVTTIELNEHLEEARQAKELITKIDAYLRQF